MNQQTIDSKACFDLKSFFYSLGYEVRSFNHLPLSELSLSFQSPSNHLGQFILPWLLSSLEVTNNLMVFLDRRQLYPSLINFLDSVNTLPCKSLYLIYFKEFQPFSTSKFNLLFFSALPSFFTIRLVLAYFLMFENLIQLLFRYFYYLFLL